MDERPWHALDEATLFEAVGASSEGLTHDEAAERLRRYGRNTIRTEETISRLRVVLNQFRSPLIYVLLFAFLVAVALRHWADGIVIAAVLVLNATIGYVQEYRAENAMLALASLVSPRATVRRGGERHEVDSETLVPGEIIHLESGDIVPADVRLIRTSELRVDDSVLTGESLPVEKHADPLPEATGLGDRVNMAFMGTVVVSGRATGVVVGTATATQVGQIASQIRDTATTLTPLQTRMHRFGSTISRGVLLVAGIVVAIGVVAGVPLVDMFLFAIALSVAAIPEGLPIVMTVALAVSVRRMAKRHAIIRRLPAVETLGSCTVIMSDKTGTLTENRMTARTVWAGGRSYELTEEGLSADGALEDDALHGGENTPVYSTLLAGVLANEGELTTDDGIERTIGDPTETALLVAGRKLGLHRTQLVAQYPELDHVPFESDRRFAATVHRVDDQEELFVKGAPERVLEMCDSVATTDGSSLIDAEAIRSQAHSMAEDGLRVLAMARGPADTDRRDPAGLTFLGLVGLLDPPRAGVPEAIAASHRAGIRVIMVTGDHASTAASIAGKIGIDGANVLTGTEVAELSDEALTAKLDEVSVYARISPTQKLRIVELLRANGEIVAVTGDGVNDAPALKAAHIGAAMGITGTDVAKEASEMVLTDDNFSTITAAVEEGRTVFANISKATHFLLTTSVGIVLAVLGLFLIGTLDLWPMPADSAPLLLLPAQIIWLNVVTNGIQDVALSFEPGEPEQFERPPRHPDDGMLSRVLVERTLLAGVLLAVVAVGIFLWELSRGSSFAYAQVATLTGVVVYKAFHVVSCRSETRSVFRKNPLSNPILLVGGTVALLIHVGALSFGPTQLLLNFQPLSRQTWLVILLLAPSVLVLAELHKLLRED